MKLKQIESILKPNKNIVLFTTEEAQWICDGAVMYPIYGMPHLTEENILVMWDIPEDKRGKWNFRYGDNLHPSMFADNAEGEQLIERGMSPICVTGAVVEPLKTEQGVLFIDQRYLKPFDDLENGYDLYARMDTRGIPYIAVKEGYALVGIISPMAVIDDRFIAELEELLALSQLAKDNRYGTKSNV